MNEATRAWLYRVLLAASAAAIVFGLITEEEGAAIVPILAALLGNGLATVNTSTTSDAP
jgi:hypothetical protein